MNIPIANPCSDVSGGRHGWWNERQKERLEFVSAGGEALGHARTGAHDEWPSAALADLANRCRCDNLVAPGWGNHGAKS
ncbi:MAG: hypothetical protein NVSMB22_00550 [Chloroflexota bacterium]